MYFFNQNPALSAIYNQSVRANFEAWVEYAANYVN